MSKRNIKASDVIMSNGLDVETALEILEKTMENTFKKSEMVEYTYSSNNSDLDFYTLKFMHNDEWLHVQGRVRVKNNVPAGTTISLTPNISKDKLRLHSSVVSVFERDDMLVYFNLDANGLANFVVYNTPWLSSRPIPINMYIKLANNANFL